MALTSNSETSVLFAFLLLFLLGISGNGIDILGHSGFSLEPNSSVQQTAPTGWSRQFWTRIVCNFDISRNEICTTGDCAGGLNCNGSGATPVTRVTFAIGTASNGNKDLYYVSLMDGYNVAIGVRATGGAGDYQYAGCVSDLNRDCPLELRVEDSDGSMVACNSSCQAFNAAKFCGTGDHSRPQTCPPTNYSKMFKDVCPTTYSYVYDDLSNTITCSGSDYVTTFYRPGSS